MAANPYQKYKQTSITSASREQILLMLYEGAIKFTKLSIAAAEQKKIAERGQNLMRAYDIIMELQVSLDHKVGGEVAKQLDQLYTFVLDQYTKMNISGDIEAAKAALKVIENLYEGWKVAVEKYKKEIDEKGGTA
ncbi:flagellar export chaperone FliS [Bdellovibrio sp. qaytius]|nr:flagellar export chaperone FliS [Bdellovibrio sp. qaytius]